MEAKAGQKLVLSQRAVRRILPHRGSALLIRQGVQLNGLEPGGQAVLVVTAQMCRGHFPGRPIIPGHLMAEAAAQLINVVAGHYYGTDGQWLLREWTCKFRQGGVSPGQSILLVVSKMAPPKQLKMGRQTMDGAVNVYANEKTVAEITNIKAAKV
jgi:3-hydroxymyristoyl/3-hydroxydecanoyl-(acyl carrier protein) dehydratase